MNSVNKKMIIAIVIIIVVLVGVIIYAINLNKNKEAEKQEIELSELLEKEEIEKTGLKAEKTKERVTSEYGTDGKYKIKAVVKMGEREGELIYIRGNKNVNIYKTEYEIGKYKDKNMEVENIIEMFKEECKNYVGINEEYEESEELLGESKAEFELPIAESINNEGREYMKKYKKEGVEYNINFYKEEEKIICELVRVF